jgi:hypothetical protein
MSTGRDTASPSSPQSSARSFAGLALAAVTAAVVFAAGQAIVAHELQPADQTAEIAPPALPPLPPAAAPPPATATTTTVPTAPAPTAVAPPPAPSAAPAAAPPPITAARTAARGTTVAAEERRPAERDKSGDKGGDKDVKDVAREAWRKNLPDISADEGRATILIPIKGSIEGATYHVNTKPKAVYVALPHAESLITMRFYGIKHDGFRTLWIKQGEGEGATLRLMLGDVYSPTVEIKDEYVRVIVRKPPPSSALSSPPR